MKFESELVQQFYDDMMDRRAENLNHLDYDVSMKESKMNTQEWLNAVMQIAKFRMESQLAITRAAAEMQAAEDRADLESGSAPIMDYVSSKVDG
jgi:hypothetical protein